MSYQQELYKAQIVPRNLGGVRMDVRYFYPKTKADILVVDAPWSQTPNPTRGLVVAYGTMRDEDIFALDLNQYQNRGIILWWVTNATYEPSLQFLHNSGYEVLNELVWIKLSPNGALQNNVGYYLQHAKEIALVAIKDVDRDGIVSRLERTRSVIFAPRMSRNQKPREQYQYLEDIAGFAGRQERVRMELFARKCNLRRDWISVGNEV